MTGMTGTRFFISLRWRIIVLAGAVLGLTSALFIWQQYQLQRHEFELNQSAMRERSQGVVNNLLGAQAQRMQLMGNLLIEQAGVRQAILDNRGQELAPAVDAIATELSMGQGVVTVAFHDADQKLLGFWGDGADWNSLIPLAKLSAKQEQPENQVSCKQTCLYQSVLPISYLGRTIATITLISNLEIILSDLHHLTRADVAVLYGSPKEGDTPLAGMRIVSASGGAKIRSLLDEARSGIWQNGRFQVERDGQVHQVVWMPGQVSGESPINFVLVSDVTKNIQLIDHELKNKFIQGGVILVLALLLLYAMLRPVLRRIRHVSYILPLLGKEKFAKVRESCQPPSRAGHLGINLADEVDELDSLALALANRLEQLRNEARQHINLLAVQTGELQQKWAFIDGLLDTAPVLILSYGNDGIIGMANAYVKRICGIPDLVGRPYSVLFLGLSHQDYALDLSAMQTGVVRRMESSISTANGTVNVLWHHARLAIGSVGVTTYLSVGMDITEHKKNEAIIHNQDFYEPLTKLPNRRMLTDCMRLAMSDSERDGRHRAVISIDLDNFKDINDSKGRNIGDALIIEVAKRLNGSVRKLNNGVRKLNNGVRKLNNGVRKLDTVAHLGGDEFVVLLEELNGDLEHAAAQVRMIVEKLRLAVNQPFLLQDYTYHFTCSVGITLFKDHEATVETLLKQANIAMSHAKTLGRNIVRFFDPEMQVRLEARAELEGDLRLALPQRQFRLFYQAQTNTDGQVIGAEALLRWLHPQRGLVTPENFIPFSEESELILPIGLWVLETACAQIKAWEADSLTHALKLAVNVSAHQFHQPDFVAQVLHILETSGANPMRLKLELTESMVLDNIADAVAKMRQLKTIGVQFSIDDFGTAYSSLSYLTQLPLDQLKIDQSFVRNIGVKPSDNVVVQTIINMANNLGMDVIAEGVETQAQRQFLEDTGCHTYQGYLYSKPLAADEFIAYLTRQVAQPR